MNHKNRLTRLEQAATRRRSPRKPLDELTDEELAKEIEILDKHCAGIPLDGDEIRQLEIIQARPHVPSSLDDMTDEELEAELARLDRLRRDRVESKVSGRPE